MGRASGIVKRSRLFPLVFGTRERLRAVSAHLRPEPADGDADLPFPLPPPELRVLVHGAADAGSFLALGEAAVAAIVDALREAGAPLEDRRRVLDFGCGSGRVLRHLGDLDAELHGVDVNPRLAGWCEQNLPFARCAVSQAEPPLPYEAGSFDLVYAISVFTHLPEQSQLRWAAELRRLLAPDGRLVLTTTGDAFRGELTRPERERFDRGELVVRHPGAAGRNACVAVHPAAYLRRGFGGALELVALRPRGLDRQDVSVFRPPRERPARGEAARS